MIRESDIAYERGEYWVLRTSKGFEVYKNGITHSVRCAIIGFRGDGGLARAVAEIDRRTQK
jgi:hypothetical protein